MHIFYLLPNEARVELIPLDFKGIWSEDVFC